MKIRTLLAVLLLGTALQASAQLPWGKTFFITAYNQKFTKEGQTGREVTSNIFRQPTRNTITFDNNVITIKIDGFIVDMLKVTDIQETDTEVTGLCVSLKYKFEFTYCLFKGGMKDQYTLWNFDLYTPVLIDRYQITDSYDCAKVLER